MHVNVCECVSVFMSVFVNNYSGYNVDLCVGMYIM